MLNIELRPPNRMEGKRYEPKKENLTKRVVSF